MFRIFSWLASLFQYSVCFIFSIQTRIIMNNKHKDTLLVVLTFTLAAILCAVVSVVIVYGEHKRNDNNENNIAACEQVLKICFSKQDICLDRLNTCIDLVDAYRDYVDINAEDVLKEKQ